MDATRKKMQSLKGQTDGLYAVIAGFEQTRVQGGRGKGRSG